MPGSAKRKRFIERPILLLLVLATACWLPFPNRGFAADEQAPMPLTGVLGDSDSARGFLRADRVREFEFPEDHGPHPGYRNEWWYLTGNLEDDSGRPFGYQLTLFRFALKPAPVDRTSAWATNQVYMGHFAVTDIRAGEFHAFERFSREAFGLAGAAVSPFRIWLEDWSVRSAGQAFFPLILVARENDIALELTLSPTKPLVLQGEKGLSRKSGNPGNASYYYSFTRLNAVGTVKVGGKSYRVRGCSWMDREWGTSSLSADQVGWDWCALQLSDGTDLMYYRLRTRGGGTAPYSAGRLVYPDGRSRPIAPGQIDLKPLAVWTSPKTSASYPVSREISIPGENLSLVVRPRLNNQEWTTSFSYWEGAVRVDGRKNKEPVRGVGYLELTGY